MDFPPEYAGMMSVGLRGGGVLFMLGTNGPVEGDKLDQLEYKREYKHAEVQGQAIDSAGSKRGFT